MTLKIISLNIGNPVVIHWNGNDVKTGIWKHSVSRSLFLGKEDVDHDHVLDRKHHGGIDKACYLYSADHYRYWKNLFPETELTWGMFGENLTVEGLHEAEVNIGDVYRVGSAIVQVTQPRQPCYKLNIRFNNPMVSKLFIESGFPGIYVRILQTGKVNVGDELILQEKQNSISVQDTFNLLYAGECDKNAMQMALNNPFLAQSCRNDLIKKWQGFI